jgi:glutamate-1-semialdehyde 2,1-aminomutase
MPAMERLRFTSSGTEAVMSALRLARAFTGRGLVLKFGGTYHGHSDAMLVDAGSGAATLGIPGSAGVPEAIAATTIVVPFNDFDAVDRAFALHAGEMAAVIVEPVVANSGVIAPAAGFLDHLREVTARFGSLLIFDEVITAFRVGPAGAQGRYGVIPDLTTLGKVIGGGMPIGAYGGRADVMRLVAPEGRVYQAGTLAGHPLAMAAGAATLDALAAADYGLLFERVDRLATALAGPAGQAGASVAHVGALITLFFRPTTPVNASQAAEADGSRFASFFGSMLDEGILLPPSQFEAWFPGIAHGDAEIEAVAEAAGRALVP